MDKKRTYQIILVVVLVGLLSACTKSAVRTNKLVKQGKWVFTQHEIGSNNVTQYPNWNLPNEPVDKEFVQGTWTHYNGSTCVFVWRFDYYEGTFTFQVDASVVQDQNAKAYIQCQNLSGTYTVLTEKSKLFEFESYESTGYPGIRVFIQIQPM